MSYGNILLPLSKLINSLTIRLNWFESSETNFVLVTSLKSSLSSAFVTFTILVKLKGASPPLQYQEINMSNCIRFYLVYVVLEIVYLCSLNYTEMPLVIC